MDIFELLDTKFDLCRQIHELNILMFSEKNSFTNNGYYCSFSQAFNAQLLRRWKYAYGRIDLADLMDDIGLPISDINYPFLPHNEKSSINSLQLAFNMISYAHENKDKLGGDKSSKENFMMTCLGKMVYILDKSGMCVVKHQNEDYYIVVPRDEKVKTAAENTDKDTAFLLYEYTSPLLKGNYKKKREILKLIANKIEPMSKVYRAKYQSGLGFDIFKDLDLILNNFEIRHPNMDSKIEKNYNEPLTKYTPKEWEEIYDTAYQMILEAFLVDNYNTIYSKIVQKHKDKIGLNK